MIKIISHLDKYKPYRLFIAWQDVVTSIAEISHCIDTVNAKGVSLSDFKENTLPPLLRNKTMPDDFVEKQNNQYFIQDILCFELSEVFEFGFEPDRTSDFVIEIPKGFMNVGITKDNCFVADTNNSENWDTIKIPLPALESGRWGVKSIIGKEVTLTKYNH